MPVNNLTIKRSRSSHEISNSALWNAIGKGVLCVNNPAA